MTRTINLLSPEALERLQAGPEGTDVAMDTDSDTKLGGLSVMEMFDDADSEAALDPEPAPMRTPKWDGRPDWLPLADPEPLPGVAGWEGAPLSATVDCGDCGHRVAFGKCCPHCAHGCSMPGDPECPANEEK